MYKCLHCHVETKYRFCSKKCNNSYHYLRKKADNPLRACEHCQANTHNILFCSKSCAALAHQNWKSKNIQRFCKTCGIDLERQTSSDRRRKCKACLHNVSHDRIKQMTLAEFHQHVNRKHGINSNSRLKTRAAIGTYCRNWNRALLNVPCQHCGYHKHVELCHVQAIANFDMNAKLAIINSPSNLLVLCPNCHWEFDNSTKIDS